jgi:hypothetical protein
MSAIAITTSAPPTNTHDVFIAIYGPAPYPLVVAVSNSPKVYHKTASMIVAALYRRDTSTHTLQYELLAYRQMTPGESWHIDFFDVVRLPIAICPDIYLTPFVAGV